MLTTEQYAELAKQAGFRIAGARATDPNRQLFAIASEHYKYVTQEQLARFKIKLRTATSHREGDYLVYDDLKLERLEEYEGCPPPAVLQAVVEARRLQIFHSYTVASVQQTKHYRPLDVDPIVFGQIADRYYIIAVWGTDLSPEQLDAQ